jgi:hypothetical protein
MGLDTCGFLLFGGKLCFFIVTNFQLEKVHFFQ